MLGSAAFRTAVAPGGVLAGPWVKNELWRRARAVPSLDLRFADNKSLVDATTGQNLVTFTRASSGTFTDSDGLIKTATTNLVLQSQNFGTSWSQVNSPTLIANSTVAPDGTTTADTLGATTSTGYFAQFITYTGDGSKCYSVFLKAGTSSQTTINNRDQTSSVGRGAATITWSAGVPSVTVTNGSVLSVQALQDGWYRISVLVSGVVAANTNSLRIQPDSSAGTGTVIAWGFQVENSSTVGEYIPTTSTINSAPRFDHNPTTGESLGLLVEEQRTNLLLRSEEFDTASWTLGQTSVSANVIESPTGNLTADKLIENTNSSTHLIQQIIAHTSGAIYTASCFVKAAERTFISLTFGSGFTGTQANSFFDLSNGTTPTPGATIVSLGNGWFRCFFTITATASASSAVQFRLATSTSVANYTGDGTSGIFLWGAQLEVGAFPTSYIPTTTATVTRSADVASITGANFSSWYRQDEGTLFADSVQAATTPVSRIVSASNNASSNRIILSRGSASGGNINITVTDASIVQVSTIVLGNSLSAGTSNKVAAVYKAADFAGSVNGLTLVTQETGTVPGVLTQLTIGCGEILGGNPMTGTIKRFTYWPQRLPNSTLQSITL